MKLPVRAMCADCLRVIEAGEDVTVIIFGDGWNAYAHAGHVRPRSKLAMPEGFP